MCGIICIILEQSSGSTQHANEIFSSFKRQISNRGPDFISSCLHHIDNHCLLIGAGVLWLQGNTLIKQPLATVLAFNGDIYRGDKIDENRKKSEGDTGLFLEAIQYNGNLVETLSELHGPYAFIHINKKKSQLLFARDPFGRRSLLVGRNSDSFVITSVAKKKSAFDFIELPALGIFAYDLANKSLSVNLWRYQHANYCEKLLQLEEFVGKRIMVCNKLDPLIANHFNEPNESDLKILKDLRGLPTDTAFELLLKNETWMRNVVELKNLLENSVRTRVRTQPDYCRDCIATKNDCNHALTGVLFSGGLDCAILAVLIDKFTDINRPIDLLNVAFDRVKDFETPDRKTGLQTLQELTSLCAERKWNFLEINITREELDRERKNIISHLIYPLNTVLDDSLGCALWFAARGVAGTYESPSRILVTGLGADELFGGYTRHRTALRREGWTGLHNLLSEEWQNISHRNLARDDRVVSDSGRQLRLPYLDENLVEFVRTLPCWEKTCPSGDLDQGFGEKLLLRTLAYLLGLKSASVLKKRALQFGSKIANPKENAHEISERL